MPNNVQDGSKKVVQSEAIKNCAYSGKTHLFTRDKPINLKEII